MINIKLKGDTTSEIVQRCLIALIILVVSSFAISWLMMLLWNFLASSFCLQIVTYKQAFAAYVLLWIIGSFFKSNS